MKNVWILICLMGLVTSGYGQDIGDGDPDGPKKPILIRGSKFKDGTIPLRIKDEDGYISIDNRFTVSKTENELVSIFNGNIDLNGILMVYVDQSRTQLVTMINSVETFSWLSLWESLSEECPDCESVYEYKNVLLDFNVTDDPVLSGMLCHELEALFFRVEVFPVVYSFYGTKNTINMMDFRACGSLGVWPLGCYESWAWPSFDFQVHCDVTDGAIGYTQEKVSSRALGCKVMQDVTESSNSFYYTTLLGARIETILVSGVYLRIFDNGSVDRVFVVCD